MAGLSQAQTIHSRRCERSACPAPHAPSALDIALQNNRRITISGLQVEQARQRVDQAQIDLLPQLSLQAEGENCSTGEGPLPERRSGRREWLSYSLS